MLNITALRKQNLDVTYNNIPANITLSGKDHVTLVFKSASLPPLVLTNYELEQSFNKSLFVTTNQRSSRNTINITPEKQFEINRITTYLKALYEIGGKKYFIGGLSARKLAIEKASLLLGDTTPPSPSTLAIWVEEDKNNVGGMSAKIAKDSIHKRKSKFSDELKLRTMALADDNHWGLGKSFQHFYNELVEIIKAEFDDYPSRETVRGWIYEIVDQKLLCKGLSKSERQKLLRNATEKLDVERPLQRVEADGASIAIGLIDDHQNYLGSFTVIFLIDAYTRCVMGYELHIGSGEPASTVISAIRHSACPKPHGSYFSQNNNSWFCYGVPELLVFDGGSGFISIETHSYVLKTMGSAIEVLPSYSPWLKPFVERFIGTFRTQCASQISGYVGKQKDQKKSDYNIKEQATHTVDEVRRFIESWIVDDYHFTPHSGLNGLTPAQKWQEALENNWVPNIPSDMVNVMLPYGKSKLATISGDSFHQGVTINRVRYNDKEGRLKGIGLWLHQNKSPAKITCKYTEDDIFAITAVCPINGDEFRIETTDKRVIPGMSITEYAAKYPSTYKQKGAKKASSLSKNPELIAGKKSLNSILSKRKPAKTRAANPDDILEVINNTNIDNLHISDANPYDDEIDWENIPTLPQS